MPDLTVFDNQKKDLLQSAHFDKPCKRTEGGDIADDGTVEIPFNKYRIGQVISEEIVQELKVQELAEPTVMATANELNQFALKFPFADASLQRYKRGIQVGLKDMKVYLPKIHRIESKLLVGETRCGSENKNTPVQGKSTYNFVSSPTITVVADTTDMRNKPDLPTAIRHNAQSVVDNSQINPNPDKTTIAADNNCVLALRAIWSPLYVKPYKSITRPVLFSNATSTTIDSYNNPEFPWAGDCGANLPYWNEKQMPIQLYDSKLYMGYILEKGRAVNGELIWTVEYSYEEIDGTDFFYREKGWIDEQTINDSLRTEPSRLFAVVYAKHQSGDSSTVSYTNRGMVKTKRLKIMATPGGQTNTETDPAPVDAYEYDAQQTKWVAPNPGLANPVSSWTFNPFAKGA
ncbi:MAG: hypothetical protein ACRCX2_39255 [Paraclostridium sp.]